MRFEARAVTRVAGEPTGKRGARSAFGRGEAGRNFGRGDIGNSELSPTAKSSADEAERKLGSEADRIGACMLRTDGDLNEAVLKQPGGDWS